MLGFQLLELFEQSVIVAVGDGGLGLDVIQPIVLLDLFAKFQDALGVGWHVEILPQASTVRPSAVWSSPVSV